MMDAEFEKWRDSLPVCISYEGRCDGNLVGLEHEENCPMRGKSPATLKDAWNAALAATREKSPCDGDPNTKEVWAEMHRCIRIIESDESIPWEKRNELGLRIGAGMVFDSTIFEAELAAAEAAERERCAQLCRRLRLGDTLGDGALKDAEDGIRALGPTSALVEAIRQARVSEAKWWSKGHICENSRDCPECKRLADLERGKEGAS